MHKTLRIAVVVGMLTPGLVHAEVRIPAPAVRTPVARVTEAMLAQRFPGRQTDELRLRAAASQWRPSTRWLKTEGKRYGVLLAVSDTHPGPGKNPLTGKLNNAEDFKAKQETDFHAMLSTEWAGAKKDGQVRTIVLNGDTLEFMQTSTPPVGKHFKSADAYGPENTPRNTRTKLQTIYRGHPKLFATYAEHLANGHRIVITPGNHDRQLTDQGVRGALRRVMVDATALHLLGVEGFDHVTPQARAQAVAKARTIVKERFEMAPPVFMHGDVFFAHGNQTDPANAFRTLLGNWYKSGLKTRDQVMEAAWGDYFVKSTFNEIEQKIPWGDNDMNRTVLAIKTMRKDHGIMKSVSHALKALKYTWTREGHGGPVEEERLQNAAKADVARFVTESRLTDKVNELRQSQAPLTSEQVTSAVMDYHAQRAQPILMMFPKEAGAFRRAVIALKNAKTIKKAFDSDTVAKNEKAALDVLFDRLGIKTYVTGHDHFFRDERYVIGQPGKERLGRLVDTATWTDGIEQVGGVEERRGVARITFSTHGSQTTLLNYHPARGYVEAEPGEDTREGLENMARAAKK